MIKNLPKDGIWRLISSDEIAKTVWNAYNSDKIHWYVPKELEDLEKEVAKNSLNAELIYWKDGKKIICHEWIKNLLDEVTFLAKKFNMDSQLDPIRTVLQEGNQSMKWINSYKEGISIEEIMKCAINDMIKSE